MVRRYPGRGTAQVGSFRRRLSELPILSRSAWSWVCTATFYSGLGKAMESVDCLSCAVDVLSPVTVVLSLATATMSPPSTLGVASWFLPRSMYS